MKNIIDYNEEDCISTHDLRNFLINNRPKDYPWFSQSEEETDNRTLDNEDSNHKEQVNADTQHVDRFSAVRISKSSEC